MSRPVISAAKCGTSSGMRHRRPVGCEGLASGPVVINLQNANTPWAESVVTTAETLWAQLRARGWERSDLVELDSSVRAFVVISGPNTQRFTPKLKPGIPVRLKLKKGDRLEFHGLGAFGPLLVTGPVPVDVMED